MPTLTLRLDGYKALPQGSKNAYIHRHTGRIVQVESVKGLKTARQSLSAILAYEAKRHAWVIPDKSIPVSIEMTFYYERGKTVTREHHTVKPDGDKAQRYLWDAITQAINIWVDDAQVTDWIGHKKYGTTNAIELTIKY
jgi:Holliday junction resolvase RusA-like endonuclease